MCQKSRLFPYSLWVDWLLSLFHMSCVLSCYKGEGDLTPPRLNVSTAQSGTTSFPDAHNIRT